MARLNAIIAKYDAKPVTMYTWRNKYWWQLQQVLQYLQQVNAKKDLPHLHRLIASITDDPFFVHITECNKLNCT